MKQIIISKQILTDVKTGDKSECFIMGLDGQPSEAFENETAFLERLSIMMKYVAPKETG